MTNEFRKHQRRSMAATIAFLSSMTTHLVAVIVLSMIVLHGQGEGMRGISIVGDASADSLDSELQEFELSSDTSMSRVEESVSELKLDNESVTASNERVALTDAPSASSDIASAMFAEASVALMMGGGGDDAQAAGGGASASGSPSGSGATFFGARANGQRFVFVIDSSTSMIGPRWEALRVELNRALRSLSEDQEFCVISFDVDAHPMFGVFPPKIQFLKAEKENIERLNRWVGSIQHGPNTRPASAIGIAIRMEPDAIFLLSDGEIRDNTIYDLRSYNRYSDEKETGKVLVPIHTVLLHSDVGFLTLKAIADENDGVFTPVSLFSARK